MAAEGCGIMTANNSQQRQAVAKWWKVVCRTFNGISQIYNVDHHHTMISDASRKGLGVYMGSDWAAGSWNHQEAVTVESTCEHIVKSTHPG